jgi:hypothetical protein
VTTTGPLNAAVGTGTEMLVGLHAVGVPRTPLNAIVLLPCDVPKVVPVIVTEVPVAAADGEMLVIPGATTKLCPLLAVPTVTITGPEVAPVGTGAVIDVLLQFVGDAIAPLKVTVLLPCEPPKFVPLIVTAVPTGPAAGDRPVMEGTVTVNVTLLLVSPFTSTATGPVVVPTGTGVTIALELQLFGVAFTPLNVTVLVPCVEPKLDPVMVTEVPTGPDGGDKLEMLGTGTVNVTGLLGAPPAVTTTGPLPAPAGTGTTILVPLQLVGVAGIPLKVTVLEPCVVPKFDPVIVTEVPGYPDVGDRLEIVEVILFQYAPAELAMRRSIWLEPPLLKYCDHLSSGVLLDLSSVATVDHDVPL